MSLILHETREQLASALGKLENSPRWDYLLSIIGTTKVELYNLFPHNQLRLYSYTKNGTTYWFAHRGYDIVRTMTYFAADGPVNIEDFKEGLILLNEEEDLTNGLPRCMLAVDKPIVETVIDFVKKETGKLIDAVYMTRFYMNKEQQKLTQILKLEVPDGYILDSCTIEDNETLMDNYHFGDNGDDEQMRRKIKCFPSSVLRSGDEVAAFYLCDPAVMLHHQFTVVKHRGKGLGKIIELDLSRKQIEKGFTPYKNVVTSNDIAISYTERSKYFTKSTDDNGNNLVLSYFKF